MQVGQRRVGVPAAVLIGEWGLVDLGRVRPEVLLVRLDAAGQAEGEQRAPVEGAAEADDGGPSGGGAGDFDRVLDRLRPGGEEHRLLVAPDRRHLAEALRKPQVRLVVDDLEGGMGGLLQLLVDRLHDARVRVADVHDADAAREVDVSLAADIPDLGALARSTVIGWALVMPRGTYLARS